MATIKDDQLVSTTLQRIQDNEAIANNEYKIAFLAAVRLIMEGSNEHVDTINTATKLLDSTGLCDSDGHILKFGDLVQKPTECNSEMHGAWAVYEIVRQGATPMLSYRYSEKGEVLPIGCLASPLSDEYDLKMFCFAKSSNTLRPITEVRRLDR
ncbi:hypothetical protein A1QO_02640 [Vibrio genomosp. F10 str. ZF-129]|uniref:Uncharacterized protein n=1 Tax=Vibrio genomosp. F10 str. ZF-129 TaxID=1187848 RepID=A0A1E5BKL1_9VIBR|nr:hypothetical protein [Vibrio genomosp. F10]OEE38295.1 hypothetical protein A1QO_02640 [Vibrio genomosp. F10 str. ZF-129]